MAGHWLSIGQWTKQLGIAYRETRWIAKTLHQKLQRRLSKMSGAIPPKTTVQKAPIIQSEQVILPMLMLMNLSRKLSTMLDQSLTTRIFKTVTETRARRTNLTTKLFSSAISLSLALTTSYVNTFPNSALFATLVSSSIMRPSDRKARALSASPTKTMQNLVSRMRQSTNIQQLLQQWTRNDEAKL